MRRRSRRRLRYSSCVWSSGLQDLFPYGGSGEFPVRPEFIISIDKAHRQTLRAARDRRSLDGPAFSHGQLYVPVCHRAPGFGRGVDLRLTLPRGAGEIGQNFAQRSYELPRSFDHKTNPDSYSTLSLRVTVYFAQMCAEDTQNVSESLIKSHA